MPADLPEAASAAAFCLGNVSADEATVLSSQSSDGRRMGAGITHWALMRSAHLAPLNLAAQGDILLKKNA
jgi:hypothetical protein